MARLDTDSVDPSGLTDCGDPDGSTSIVVGASPVRGEIGGRLLQVLPLTMQIPADTEADPVSQFLATEVAADRPGQQVVLDRVLDWLLVCSLRAWFDDRPQLAPQWYSALHDPIVGPVLELMHAEVGSPWTVDALARRAGVSRATLAKRFTDLVGDPPLTYLTQWRMTIAADHLTDRPDLSIAFKRTKGVNPSTHRAQATLVR